MTADLRQTIDRALAGDAAAFEALIGQYARLVYAQAFSVVRNHAEAEDIVQDTFIKAFKYRSLLKEPDCFPQWILAITRNMARDHLRRRRHVVAFDRELAEFPDASVPRPGRRLDRRELRDRLLAALALLPERHRLALELRYIEGLDYRTIESNMGVTNGALRGILDRARGSLRRLLSPMMDE